MSVTESYRDKAFVVDDADARIRSGEDLLTFATYQQGEALPPGGQVGDFKRIAPGTEVRIVEVQIAPTGTVFANAQAAAAGAVSGWTSSRNLRGKFVNETLGERPPANDDQKGDNAAWEAGSFIGQKTLVAIVAVDLQVKRIMLETAKAYLDLVADARTAGVTVALTSGFRTFAEQTFLFDGFSAHKPGFNTAAVPGRSNHQHGRAFDIAVSGFDGDPVYDWLKRNAPRLGFIRTVNKEPWHWEFRPEQAAALAANGRFKADGVAT
jgi:hypothetical protein